MFIITSFNVQNTTGNNSLKTLNKIVQVYSSLRIQTTDKLLLFWLENKKSELESGFCCFLFLQQLGHGVVIDSIIAAVASRFYRIHVRHPLNIFMASAFDFQYFSVCN